MLLEAVEGCGRSSLKKGRNSNSFHFSRLKEDEHMSLLASGSKEVPNVVVVGDTAVGKAALVADLIGWKPQLGAWYEWPKWRNAMKVEDGDNRASFFIVRRRDLEDVNEMRFMWMVLRI